MCQPRAICGSQKSITQHRSLEDTLHQQQVVRFECAVRSIWERNAVRVYLDCPWCTLPPVYDTSLSISFIDSTLIFAVKKYRAQLITSQKCPNGLMPAIPSHRRPPFSLSSV